MAWDDWVWVGVTHDSSLVYFIRLELLALLLFILMLFIFTYLKTESFIDKSKIFNDNNYRLYKLTFFGMLCYPPVFDDG